MNTEDMVSLMMKKGYTKKEAQRVLDDVEDCIVEKVIDGATVTWKGFMRFGLKKYNILNPDGSASKMGTVHYVIRVTHLNRVSVRVRQLTKYKLNAAEIKHNEYIFSAQKEVAIRRWQKKKDATDQGNEAV